MTHFVSEMLERVAPQACVEVFGSYGVTLTQIPQSAPRGMSIPPLDTAPAKTSAAVAGFIGFSGPKMRGSVLIASTFNVVARARPAALKVRPLSSGSSSDWILVRDWAAELVNQVLGRIKNRLHSVNVTLDVSTPAALSGKALAFAKPKSSQTKPILFDAHPDQIWFWFDALWTEDLAPSPGQAEGAKEGDVILF